MELRNLLMSGPVGFPCYCSISEVWGKLENMIPLTSLFSAYSRNRAMCRERTLRNAKRRSLVRPLVLGRWLGNSDTCFAPVLMMRLVSIVFVSISLGACASGNDRTAAIAADVLPQWLGGLPPDAPPRRGTPEYEAWQAERAKEAARPKSGPKP
jgi:hypothetical protein